MCVGFGWRTFLFCGDKEVNYIPGVHKFPQITKKDDVNFEEKNS